jgi:pimeloyl-ACP methyl ester carboxylesterase
MAGHCADWDLVVALIRVRHRVLRYDRPGLGRSPVLHSYPSLADEVSRIDALINHYDLRDPIVVAHSAAALHAEAYARQHPGVISGLVLVDPSWDSRSRPRGRYSAAAARYASRAAAGLLRAADVVRLPALLGPAMWRLAASSMTKHASPPATGGHPYRAGRVAAAAYGEWLAYRDWVADLEDVRRVTPAPSVPAVVITALAGLRREGSRRRWRHWHGKLAALLPGARQVVVRDAAHMVAFDRPDVVAAAIAEVAERAPA